MTLLAANVMHFARLLRRAGLPVGPSKAMAALRALTLIDIGDRAQVRTALRACMTHRREHREVFDAAFDLFWRDPAAAEQAAAMALLDARKDIPRDKPPPAARRVAEAFQPPRERKLRPDEKPPHIDVALTASEREHLQTMDFEAMSAAEIAAAKREIRRLALPLQQQPTRRQRPDPRGNVVDLRRTIRTSLRQGGEIFGIARTRQVTRPPPLVVLCDISGSMARYAQILLHFLHAVINERERVHVFLFGTRLTNITRQLRHRDPEVAFQMVAHIVPDWSGGTRIGETLDTFNRQWARRLLGQGAIVLLITDGLDRPRTPDQGAALGAAMDRLHRSCRRLIWLNPLLRWDGFEPRSQSIRAMLAHVDDFRTVHSLESLRTLVDLLSRPESGTLTRRFAPTSPEGRGEVTPLPSGEAGLAQRAG